VRAVPKAWIKARIRALITARTLTVLLAVPLMAAPLQLGTALVLPLAPAAASSWIEQQPTAAEVSQQRERVRALAQQERERAGAVSGRQAALRSAASASGLALEAFSASMRSLAVAQDEEHHQQELLAAAEQVVQDNRDELGRWARQAYQGGGPLSTHVTLTALLQADSGADVSTTLKVLNGIGATRNRVLETVEAAQHQQAAATEAAADASQGAEQAAVKAASARQAADEALAAQRVALGRAEAALDDTRTELTRAQQRRTELQAAALLGTSSVGRAGGNRVTGQVGSCTGGDDVEQYPNGRIPLAALCPLRANGGHYLRADAAFALDRLTVAYTQRFGEVLCITDSYRSLAAQVDVYARKPGLAAVPGTSNHGWGTAADLCGGIQQFESAQHHWMQVYAPLYGWFHPAWAQPGGSKPEPWHWEFAG
jgi:D-alanyl-D-alanine carboxypeptidase